MTQLLMEAEVEERLGAGSHERNPECINNEAPPGPVR